MVLLIIAILVIALLIASIRIVPQGTEYVIEFLGKYKATWPAGLHFKIPFLERVVKKVSLKEQVLDFPPQGVITRDNVSVSVDSVVFAKVFDANKFTYGVEDAYRGLENLSATTLRAVIGEMDLDETLSNREIINTKMEEILDKATDAWGLQVTRVELKNIDPPREIEEVMTKQMRAEREKRQTILEAEAHQEAVQKQAEGDKRAKVLAAEAERDAQIAVAEGRAESIRLVYEAEAEGLRLLQESGFDERVLRLKGLEALKDVADGNATKIFMPSDLTEVVSTLGVVGETLGIGSALGTSSRTKEASPVSDVCDNKPISNTTKNVHAVNRKLESFTK